MTWRALCGACHCFRYIRFGRVSFKLTHKHRHPVLINALPDAHLGLYWATATLPVPVPVRLLSINKTW